MTTKAETLKLYTPPFRYVDGVVLDESDYPRAAAHLRDNITPEEKEAVGQIIAEALTKYWEEHHE